VTEPKRKHLPIIGNSPPMPSSGGGAPSGREVKPPPPTGSGEKRRLPLIASSPEPEGEETPDRPPWHWAGLGAMAVFFAWLPLAALVGSIIARVLRSAPDGGMAGAPLEVRLLMIGLHALAFAMASAMGGFLVGRYGGLAGWKEAAASGAVAAVVAWAIAFAQAPKTAILVWVLLLVAIGAVGALGGFVGGRIGLARRPAAAR
jgi:tRNA-(ms[2]io[6]A)-hydroxylase